MNGLRKAWCFLILGVFLCGLGVDDLTAQTNDGEGERQRFYSSSYLPLTHWAYDYLNVLITRGRLPRLSRTIQPYRRVDIVEALAEAKREGRLRPVELEWSSEIRQELTYAASLVEGQSRQQLRFAGELSAGAKVVSQRHRDLFRPRDDDALWAVWQTDFSADAPAIASAFRFRWDRQYIRDPQFSDGRVDEFRACDPIVDECSYRVEEAYVELQIPFVRVFFGRMYRNQGISRLPGFLIGNYNYSYDHLGYQFGTPKLSLTGLFAPVNDFPSDTGRYFASHRLDWQIRDNLLLSLGESTIYGGPDARVDFSLINPLSIWEIAGDFGTRNRNTMGLLEMWWRPFSWIAGYGSLLVDNTRVDDPGLKEGLTQYGAAFGLQFPTIAPTFALDADLSILSSLVYRSRVGFQEYYAINGIGIARDNTDTVTLSLLGNWLVNRNLTLKPEFTWQQKGEGDITQVWPDDAFSTYPNLLVGTVQHTLRPALPGRFHLPFGDIGWDVGLNFVKNQGNMERGWDVDFVGTALIKIRWGFSNVLIDP